jgi:hypothetical protein
MQPPRYVLLRDRVDRLIRTDLEEALRTAREIDHPWYRCQALATVAVVTTDARARRRLLEEAFRAAEEQEEPNRVVTVSSWPLKVLALDEPAAEILERLRRLVERLDREPHPVRRCDALFMLAYHLRDLARPAFVEAAKLCARAAHEAHGWKRDRNLKDLALMAWARGERSLAGHLRDEIEEARVRRQASKGMREEDFGVYAAKP